MEVHFESVNSKCSYVKTGVYDAEAGTLTVDVPDGFLAEPTNIIKHIWLYANSAEGGNTLYEIKVPIRERQRPADYVEPDDLRKDEVIESAVASYIERHSLNPGYEINSGETVLGYVAAEVNRLAEVVRSHQTVGSVTIIACSDFHQDLSGDSDRSLQIQASNQHALQAIYQLCKTIKVDMICGLGDYTWCCDQTTDKEQGLSEVRSIIGGLKTAAGSIPLMLTTGNHDPLADARTHNEDETYSNSVGENYIYSSEMYSNVEIFNDYVSENTVGYGFRDFPNHKLRVICLNTADSDGNINPNAYSNNGFIGDISQEQARWLVKALNLSEKADCASWKILILGHHPLDWGRLIPIVKLLKAYEDGASGSISYQNSYSGVNVVVPYDFTGKNAAQLIGQIHGHVHGFRVDNLHYLDDNNTLQTVNAKKIAIPNACFYRTNEYGLNGANENNGLEMGVPKDSSLYKKTANSEKDTSFCVITLDLQNYKIFADHYGAGYDREIDTFPFTNIADECTDGIRLKSNGITTVANEYMTVSSLIPVTEGDFILFGEAKWQVDSARDIYSMFFLYDSSQNCIGKIMAVDVPELIRYNANLYQIQITADTFPDVNISNVSYCRISLAGSSESLRLLVLPAERSEDLPAYMNTNLVPTSVDANGNVYNTTGYADNTRLNTSGVTKATSGCAVTGFISAKENDIIHFGGGEWISKEYNEEWAYSYVWLYDAAKQPIGYIGTVHNTATPALDLDSYRNYTIVLDNTVNWTSAPNDYSQIAYVRISLLGSGADLKVYKEG